MFILLLLFVLTSFLLLALDGVTLSQIVVLVFNHISMFHVVDLFLIVRINLCIAKSLLFPTECSTSTVDDHDHVHQTLVPTDNTATLKIPIRLA
jgi:hypothetical protein